MEFVVAENFRADDPTHGIKLPKARAGGFHTWTEAEIAQFEERYPNAPTSGARVVALYRPGPG